MAGLVSSQEKYFMDIKDFKIKKSQWLIFIVLSAGLMYNTAAHGAGFCPGRVYRKEAGQEG